MMEQISSVVVMNNNNKLAGRGGDAAASSHDDDDNQDDDFADSSIDYLPPGFRFHPTDEEIIIHYLCRKVHNTKFTASAVGEVDLNKCEPWDLPNKAKMGEKEWYFFCQRDRKYPTGTRTNRATDAGYWKATGKDKEIYKGQRQQQQQQQQQKGCLVGMKKTLVFYRGRAPKGEKSNWVMHEYRLEGKFSYYNLPKSAKAEWVVCRVFHKKSSENGMVKKNPYSSCSSSSSSLLRMNSFGDEEYLFMNSPSLPPLVLAAPHDHHHFNSNTTTTTTTAAAAAGSTTFMNNNNNNNISIGKDHQQGVVQKEDQEFKSMTKSARFFDTGSTTHHDQLNISYNPTGSIMGNNNYCNNINYQQQGNPSPNTPHPNSNNYNNNNNIFYPQNIPNSPQFSFHGSSNMGFENNIIPSSCFPNSYFSNTTDQAILKALADYESSSSYDNQLMIKRECKVEPFHSNNTPMVSRSQDTGLSTDMNTEISSVITKHEDNLGNNNGSYCEDHHVPASSDDPVVDLDCLWDY